MITLMGPVKKHRSLLYPLKESGKPQVPRPWLGGLFAGAYDRIMEKKVFPHKFGSDLRRHQDYLLQMMKELLSRETSSSPLNLVDLACGNGVLIDYLPLPDPQEAQRSLHYTGIDISPALMMRGAQRAAASPSVAEYQFVAAGAENTCLAAGEADLVVCLLAFNFFENAGAVLREIHRILKPGGTLFLAVPAADRQGGTSAVRGNLLSSVEWSALGRETGFRLEIQPESNGRLLYALGHSL